MKVKRIVDTVIVEMDSGVADMLLTVLGAVDHELYSNPSYQFPLHTLRDKLAEHLRNPHPLYRVTLNEDHSGLLIYHDYNAKKEN